MSDASLAMVDAALLCISEARERADEAVRLTRESGESALTETLTDVERQLHNLHGELMRAVYMPEPSDTQLRLAG